MYERALSGRQISSREIERYGLNQEGYDWLKRQKTVPAIIERGKGWECQRCGSNQPESFYPIEKGKVYCLHCFLLGRLTNEDMLYRIPAQEKVENIGKQTYLSWQGQLSHQQEMASDHLLESLKRPEQIHIIQAVTGAGKTEIVFKVIDTVLRRGGRVGLVSPRIDVCLELAPRIQSAFNKVEIQVLHGRVSEPARYSSIVISTNHQLWKFYQAFDLIIVDEVDAFPLIGDEGLHFGVRQALKVKGKLIYLTATPDQYLSRLLSKGQAEVTILPARFHGYPLPVPDFVWLGDWSDQISKRKRGLVLKIVQKFLLLEGTKLIFMPDIYLADLLFKWIMDEIPDRKIQVVHAKDPDRLKKVQDLREGRLECLVTTTILERGVTFVNCQVLIVGAEHPAFTAAALIQMSGRVGRNAAFPIGTLIYGHFGKSMRMMKARRDLQYMNRLAREKGFIREKA